MESKQIPVFSRDLTGESAEFVAGFRQSMRDHRGNSLKKLGALLHTATQDCKAKRREGSRMGNPTHDRREGNRAALHDLYYSGLYTSKEYDLDREIATLRLYFSGVRLQIALWAKGIREGRGKPKSKQQPVRQSHASRSSGSFH